MPFNRKDILLAHYLPAFNEQMADDDWQDMTAAQAERSALFHHWLREWSDDSRGKLLILLQS
jgi:hypothetical protein